MDIKTFSDLNKIIERGKKSSTYKFALLRATIDIIQENSPYLSIEDYNVKIPLGLVVEKWLVYYYPIYQSEIYIPQNTSENSSFEPQLKKLICYYNDKNGFSAFYNDLKNNSLPDDTKFKADFFELLKSIRDTIVSNPMKHIGYSINKKHDSIYSQEKKDKKRLYKINSSKYRDIENIINDFGLFSISREYYEIFKLLGNFINGQDSILFKWAEFSVNASNQNLSIEKVLNEVLKSPITQRNINESKRIYKEILEKHGDVICVWTEKKIRKYDIDHIIPFSVWRNNDLWNLLPSSSNINRKSKRDKIPSPKIIEDRKDLILNYWEIIFESSQSERFQKEIQVALLGNKPFASWKENGITQLKESCNYLIENRGFEEWTIEEWKI